MQQQGTPRSAGLSQPHAVTRACWEVVSCSLNPDARVDGRSFWDLSATVARRMVRSEVLAKFDTGD